MPRPSRTRSTAAPAGLTVEQPPVHTNGHMPAAGEPVMELARLVVEIDRKGAILAQLARGIEPLRPLRLTPVEGESALYESLDTLLGQARALVWQIANADAASIPGIIAQLNELLTDVQWELLEETIKGLATKRRQQDELLQQYKGQVERHRLEYNSLKVALEQAARVHAPVRLYAEQLRRMESRLRQADRTLVNFEQPFPVLVEAVQALAQESGQLEGALKRIEQTVRETERIIRNADLLLMQAPLDFYSRYQYEVGLRIAGEPGAHGVNVQASIKLVQQDRELMQHAIKQITAVVTGQARKESTPEAVTAEASTEPPTPVVAVETEATRSALRAYLFGETEPGVELTAPLSSLVREMGDLMYRLFLPDTVQEYLRTTTCSLTVATNDLELPWEFMYYNHTPDAPAEGAPPNDDAENFLCLSRPIARRLMGRPLPTDRPPRLDRPAKRQFLFIANPTGDLPGAEREVTAVVEALKQNWSDLIEVTELKGAEANGRHLNQLLRSDRFDVIHYSGHAFFDDNDPDYSGLLLHGREIFFADKVRRLLGGRPLVFLNACESARAVNESRAAALSYNLQKPAQGLAASFVYGGALGCIGSLWPINDLRAARFAVEFYNQVLEGHLIGEAMRRARIRIKEDAPDEITWAAFVLYGDPTFRLVE
jgi:hypothetical protein